MVVAGVTGARLFAPDRADAVLRTAREYLVAGLAALPEPVFVAAALALGVVLWFVAFKFLLVWLYRGWRRVSARVYWLLTLVLPESPLVKFAAGAMVMIVAIVVLVGALPVLFGDLAETDEGAAGYVNNMNTAVVNGEWEAIVAGDAIGGEPACDGSVAGDDSGARDRDADGLPDAWERAGETPTGAALPDADPFRKDLYVQVNYGTGVDPLTDAEGRDLRETWAAMPVANPDGSTGVTVHVETDVAGAGRFEEPAAISSRRDRDAFYTADSLGPRRCVYRQVVYGRVNVGEVAGVASMPGYAAVVDGARQPAYEGDVSFRVALTTHELLHTVAGRVDGRPHTNEGWLAGGSDDEFLSGATAADLNETGIHGPAS